MAEIADRATAGVGWNSGGLDLVSAAGLPVLRIGEYQKRWAGSSIPRERTWGASDNSFLAVATNIGLAPSTLDAELFSQSVLRKSVNTFLGEAEQGQLAIPRHVIMPPGYALEREFLEQDLDNFSIDWPGEPGVAASFAQSGSGSHL